MNLKQIKDARESKVSQAELIRLANKAGQSVIDAKYALLELAESYENPPASRVQEVLDEYDMSDFKFKKMKDSASYEQGKTREGEDFTEDNLKAGEYVLYKGKNYKTGNRHHDQVELYDGDEFVKTVKMSSVRLVDAESPLIGATFKTGGTEHMIKNVVNHGKFQIYQTYGGKEFNSKALEKLGVEIVPKEKKKRVGVPWSEDRKRISKKEFESRLKEMATPSEGEEFDHSEMHDLAWNLYQSDDEVVKYMEKVVMPQNYSHWNSRDVIDELTTLMENIA